RFVSEPCDDQLPHGAFVGVKLDPFVDVLDLAALPLSLSDLAVSPAICGQSSDALQHAQSAPTDGDEATPALRQLAQAGIGCRTRVEQQTCRIVPCLFFPVVSELR